MVPFYFRFVDSALIFFAPFIDVVWQSGFTKIEGLTQLGQLRCLYALLALFVILHSIYSYFWAFTFVCFSCMFRYLQENMIDKMENLDALTALDTLNLNQARDFVCFVGLIYLLSFVFTENFFNNFGFFCPAEFGAKRGGPGQAGLAQHHPTQRTCPNICFLRFSSLRFLHILFFYFQHECIRFGCRKIVWLRSRTSLVCCAARVSGLSALLGVVCLLKLTY